MALQHTSEHLHLGDVRLGAGGEEGEGVSILIEGKSGLTRV